MTTKNFKIVKSEFYINDISDWGYHKEDIATCEDMTKARQFCKENINEICKGNECLEIQRCFNETNVVYVEETYTL